MSLSSIYSVGHVWMISFRANTGVKYWCGIFTSKPLPLLSLSVLSPDPSGFLVTLPHQTLPVAKPASPHGGDAELGRPRAAWQGGLVRVKLQPAAASFSWLPSPFLSIILFLRLVLL